MTYNPNIPQAPDLPSDSQPDIDSNFISLNQVFGVDHIPFGNLIEAATLAAPCVITSTNHRLTTADTVTVFNMEGITTAGVREDWSINGTLFIVTVVDDDTFSLDGSNTATEPVYLANSGDFTSAALPYGNHTKNFFPSPVFNPPNRANPKSAYFSQNIMNIAELFFQNDQTVNDIFPLTNIPISATTLYNIAGTALGKGLGFTTPWGITLNFGQLFALKSLTLTHNYAVAYTSQVFSFTMTLGPASFFSTTPQQNPFGRSVSNTQFQIGYATGSAQDANAIINFIAIGI